jgi:hypothetical protein
MRLMLFGITSQMFFIQLPMLFIALEAIMQFIIFSSRRTTPSETTLLMLLTIFLLYYVPVINIIMFVCSVIMFIKYINGEI